MPDWLVLLTPLALLPIVLLFVFVGCALSTEGTGANVDPGPAPKPKPVDPPTFTFRYEVATGALIDPKKPAFVPEITGEQETPSKVLLNGGFTANALTGVKEGETASLSFPNDVPATPLKITWVCHVIVDVPAAGSFFTEESPNPLPTFVATYKNFKTAPKTLVLRRVGDLTFELKPEP